jgi:uncharacterized protein YegP (UPF0339 family)
MSAKRIEYSEKYADDDHEYRWVNRKRNGGVLASENGLFSNDDASLAMHSHSSSLLISIL